MDPATHFNKSIPGPLPDANDVKPNRLTKWFRKLATAPPALATRVRNDYAKGRPTCLHGKSIVAKIAWTRSSIRRLMKEAANSQYARGHSMYGDLAVKSRFIFPNVAIAPRINDLASTEEKIRLLVAFCEAQLQSIKVCGTGSASHVVKRFADDLNVDISESSELAGYINLRQLDFELPITIMHGDFSHSNALHDGESLKFIDWEYSLPEGSAVYDWWRFRRRTLDVYKRSNVNAETLGVVNSFVNDALAECSVNQQKWDKFGSAMFLIQRVARARGGRQRSIDGSMRKLVSLPSSRYQSH